MSYVGTHGKVANFCEQGEEPSVSMKCGVILDYLRKLQILIVGFATTSQELKHYNMATL